MIKIINFTWMGRTTCFRGSAQSMNYRASDIESYPAQLKSVYSGKSFVVEVLDWNDSMLLPQSVEFTLDPDAFDFISEDGDFQVNLFNNETGVILLGRMYINGDQDDYWELVMQFSK